MEKYRSLSRDYYGGTNGIILVYDVTDRTSFDNLSKYWLPKISENADSNIELVLIGNKTDLINDRQVSEEEARHLLETDPNIKKQV
jgi:GTPase SAR1 family protein